MGTCVIRSWALLMDWVGKKSISNKGINPVYACSVYASLQILLFRFELMHSSNVTFTRFSYSMIYRYICYRENERERVMEIFLMPVEHIIHSSPNICVSKRAQGKKIIASLCLKVKCSTYSTWVVANT